MKLEPLKNIAMVLGLVTTIITTTYVIDSRYAHAKQLEETQFEVARNKQETIDFIKDFTKKQRIQDLSDKIFDIQIKGELDAVDKAKLTRYQNELDYLLKSE